MIRMAKKKEAKKKEIKKVDKYIPGMPISIWNTTKVDFCRIETTRPPQDKLTLEFRDKTINEIGKAVKDLVSVAYEGNMIGRELTKEELKLEQGKPLKI